MELERIESLLKLMQEYGVAELGIEEESTAVHLRLMEAGAAGAAAALAAPAALVTAAATPTASQSRLGQSHRSSVRSRS